MFIELSSSQNENVLHDTSHRLCSKHNRKTFPPRVYIHTHTRYPHSLTRRAEKKSHWMYTSFPDFSYFPSDDSLFHSKKKSCSKWEKRFISTHTLSIVYYLPELNHICLPNGLTVSKDKPFSMYELKPQEVERKRNEKKAPNWMKKAQHAQNERDSNVENSREMMTVSSIYFPVSNFVFAFFYSFNAIELICFFSLDFR